VNKSPKVTRAPCCCCFGRGCSGTGVRTGAICDVCPWVVSSHLLGTRHGVVGGRAVAAGGERGGARGPSVVPVAQTCPSSRSSCERLSSGGEMHLVGPSPTTSVVEGPVTSTSCHGFAFCSLLVVVSTPVRQKCH